MAKKKNNNSIIIWGGIALVIVFGLYKLFTAEPLPAYTVIATDHIKGNTEAELVLMEYSDFQCPACALTYPNLKKLSELYPEDIQIVYRHYPLTSIHAYAFMAAKATEAAAIQGKFWEMHDLIFENQTIWSNMDKPLNAFTNYATQLGLNLDQFLIDMESSEVEKKINWDIKAGNAAGVTGTPSLYVNGEKIQNFSTIEAYREYFDTLLAE